MICINRRCQAEIEDSFLFCPHCGRKQEAAPKRKSKRPNGTGSVYKLSGNRTRPWVVARNNKPMSYHATKAEALIALEKLAGKAISERANYTFAEVYEEWRKEHSRDIAEHSITTYDAAYKWFSPVHNKKFRALRTSDFQAIIDSVTEAGRKRASADKAKQLANQMSQWAIREDICDKNYAAFVRLPDNDAAVKAIFTDQQIAALEADSSEAARIVLMLIYTGVRIGELFSATMENYHETYYITGSKTEAGRDRVVPIPPVAQPHFKYFAEKSSALILDSYVGNRTARMFRARDFKVLMQKHGIENVTPHSARHTFVSRAVATGVPAESLKLIVGHATYATTVDVYNHASAEQLIKAAQSMWDCN